MLTAQDWVAIIVGVVVIVLGGYFTHIFSVARNRLEEKFISIQDKLKYVEEVAEKCRENIAVNEALDRERKENIDKTLHRIESKLSGHG